jgi:hypothetical protein
MPGHMGEVDDRTMLERLVDRQFDDAVTETIRAWRNGHPGALADALDRLDYCARAVDR